MWVAHSEQSDAKRVSHHTEEQLCWESTVGVGKGRGQQAVGSSSISGTSGSGSQSSVYNSGISVDREFDSAVH